MARALLAVVVAALGVAAVSAQETCTLTDAAKLHITCPQSGFFDLSAMGTGWVATVSLAGPRSPTTHCRFLIVQVRRGGLHAAGPEQAVLLLLPDERRWYGWAFLPMWGEFSCRGWAEP